MLSECFWAVCHKLIQSKIPMSTTADRSRPVLFRGWWIVAVTAVGQSLGVGTMLMYTFGVFAKPLAAEFASNRGAISLAVSLLNIMVTINAPAAGWLVDRFGGRRVIVISILALAVCLFALSRMTPPLWQLYGLYALAGIAGVASSPVAYSRVVANWFDRRRGLALGLSSAGVGVGAFIMPSLAHFFIEQYSWRRAYTALGCASLLIAAPVVALFLRGSPQEVGLSPDGVKETRAHDPRAGISAGMTAPEALRTLTFWQLCFIFFCVSASANGTITHLASLLTDQGVSGRSAALATSLFGAATILGRVGNGYLVDRFFAPYVAAALFGGGDGPGDAEERRDRRRPLPCVGADRPGHWRRSGRHARPWSAATSACDPWNLFGSVWILHNGRRRGAVPFWRRFRCDRVLPRAARLRPWRRVARDGSDARIEEISAIQPLRPVTMLHRPKVRLISISSKPASASMAPSSAPEYSRLSVHSIMSIEQFAASSGPLLSSS